MRAQYAHKLVVEPDSSFCNNTKKPNRFPPIAIKPMAMFGHRASVGKTCSTDEVIFPPSAVKPMAMFGHHASVGKACSTDEVMFPLSAVEPMAMFWHRASVGKKCNTNEVMFSPKFC